MIDFRLSKDWKVWVYLTSGTTLGVVELYAALTGPAGDTISERVWGLGWPVAMVLGLGCMVLGIHFAFQGRKDASLTPSSAQDPSDEERQDVRLPQDSDGIRPRDLPPF